jgi:hypothetical protein
LLICTAGTLLLLLLLLLLTAGVESGSGSEPDEPLLLLLPLLSAWLKELLGSSMRFTLHMSSESMNLQQQCIRTYVFMNSLHSAKCKPTHHVLLISIRQLAA